MHNEQYEIECCMLDILLTNPNKVYDVIPHLKTEMLSSEEHQEIYHHIVEGLNLGELQDYKTIAATVGCKDYLPNLMGLGLVKEQAATYAKTIQKIYTKRCIAEIIAANMDELEKAEQIKEVVSENENRINGKRDFTLDEALEKTYKQIEDTHRNGGYIGLDTGLPELDKYICGLESEALYILAARPSMGKTALAMTIALNLLRQGKVVQFFSIEMSKKQLANRVFARYSNNDIYQQKTGNADFSSLLEARKKLKGSKLYGVSAEGMNADQICESAKSKARHNKPDIIMIDHLGIVASSRYENRRDLEIGYMTMKFKNLSKELDCPVLLVHQLNRGTEQRENKRPTLADLRDSGSVEQDADLVMMIYREEYYLERQGVPEDHDDWVKYNNKLDGARGRAEIIITKSRQGECGTVNCIFDGKKQEFR